MAKLEIRVAGNYLCCLAVSVITQAFARGGYRWFPCGMGRSELERLSKEELIELVLRLQRPEKTSRTSSKPPSTDRKEQREQAKPGGAKSGHEGHRRTISQT